MFRKLLSNLPFNPSLINQVAFYTKRLKAESSVRRLGVMFLVLAMGVQMFAAAVPSQPTLAQSGNDVISGGFSSKGEGVNHCKRNTQGFKDILAHFGIDCLALYYGSERTIHSSDYGGQLYSMGRSPRGFSGEVTVRVPKVGALYMRPLSAWGSSSYKAIVGNASDGSPFMILYSCGNLVIVGQPAPPPPPPPPPPAGVKCTNLTMTVPNKSEVKLGTTVSVRGQAVGKNLRPNQRVIMNYQFINKATGKILDQKRAEGLKFKGSTVQDTIARPFKVTEPGRYVIKLIVRYDGGTKVAKGSGQGNCIKEIRAVKEKPCIPTDDEVCVTLSKKAKNDTTGTPDANDTTVNGGDVITYTLIVKNISANNKAVKDYIVEENMIDVLEYADIVNLHGGKISDSNIVSWPAIDIGPGETIEKQITIKVKDPIPSTPASSSDPDSYDCIMTNIFGDVIQIRLPCAPEKTIEQVTTTLPNTGPGETLAVAVTATVVASYFFARSRLMAKELDIVRVDYATSGGN